MAQVKPFREQYLASRFLCEVCIKRKPEHVHEITCGPSREASLDKPELVLAVCEKCHREIHDRARWSVARQLALKFLRTPLLVQPELVNEVRGRSENAITWDDIVQELVLKP